jgi:hypothetical protein
VLNQLCVQQVLAERVRSPCVMSHCPSCRFQKAVPTGLKDLVTECWSPAMDDRPDFGTITRRLEHIAKALPEVWRLPRTCRSTLAGECQAAANELCCALHCRIWTRTA